MLALLPLLCVALGGGTARWSQGIVLILLGGVLVAAPPRASLGRWLNAALGAMFLLALTAFLPARWFSWPLWRAALTEDFSIALPGTLSAQPWLSAEGAVLFLAGIAWCYRMGTLRWTADERLRAGRIYAFGAVVLAAVFTVLYKLDVVVPFWLNTRHFGPFPNRNQTANFLAVGALPVLACAYTSWRGSQRAAALGWLFGWLVVAVAVFNNFSRAGVGILFIGTAAYLVGEAIRSARRRKPYREVKEGDPLPDVAIAIARWRRVAVAASMILVLGSGFFIFGGDTLERFQFDSAAGAESVVTDDFRMQIQRDTARMVAASPWGGVGLDNFAEVFQMARHRSASPVWLNHPESDWLWMAAELGWPSVLLTLAALALFARLIWPMRRGVDRPLRAAAALACGLFALHGLVDVSAHRLGTALCGLFVLGLAMPGTETDEERREGDGEFPIGARWPVGLFRAAGALFVAVGTLWLLESGGQITAPGLVGATRLKEQAVASGAAGDYASAENAATQALAWAPLDWELYFARATARVCRRGNTPDALDDFRRARYLEPFAADPCYIESRFWAAANEPSLAINAIIEACRREPARASDFMNDVPAVAAEGKSVFRERLRRAVRRNPVLELAYLRSLDPSEMPPVIAAIVKDDPDLGGFNDTQKKTFLHFWAQGGDPHALAAAVEVHPSWQPLGWRWWATAYAKDGREERACGIATRYAPKPAVPPASSASRSLAEWQNDVAHFPRDPVAALGLYRAQHAAGDAVDALNALHHITIQTNCPPYFFYLEALQAAEIGQWKEGWTAWENYLEKTSAGQ